MGNKATKDEINPYLRGKLGKINSVCKYANDNEQGQRLPFHRACVRLLSDECLSKRSEFADCLTNTANSFTEEKQPEGDTNGKY